MEWEECFPWIMNDMVVLDVNAVGLTIMGFIFFID